MNKQADKENNEAPPFFKSWGAIYIILVVFLVAQILFYYFLTEILK